MKTNYQSKGTILKLIICVSVFIAMSSSVIAADLTGVWKTSIETPMGAIEYTFNFQQKDAVLTGTIVYTIENEKHESKILDGKITEGKVTFYENMSMQGSDMKITYEGKIDGDVVNFSRNVADFGSESFIAKRQAATK